MSHRSCQKFLGRSMTAALALSQAILRVPNAQRAIPRVLGVTAQTVSNWIDGKSAPSADNLISLMAEFDEVADAVLEASNRKQHGLTHEQRSKLLKLLGDE